MALVPLPVNTILAQLCVELQLAPSSLAGSDVKGAFLL